MRRVIPSLLAVLLGVAGCATPSSVLCLMDARTDDERADAEQEACELLEDEGARLETRLAAAKVLGRLRLPSARAVESLGGALRSEHAPEALRDACAWALGEMRHERSLAALRRALRSPLSPSTGQRVLDALACHMAVITASEDSQLETVEALVYFAGNQRTSPSPIYDELSERLRTLPVNARVLQRAVDQLRGNPDFTQQAAVYLAAFELLVRLEDAADEIASAPGAWEARLEQAMQAALSAYALDFPPARMLVLWYLGKLAPRAPLAKSAARGLLGERGDAPARPGLSRRASLRHVGAWALARMQLHALGPRRALLVDLLSREREPEVLRLLGDLAREEGESDLLQRILGIDTRQRGDEKASGPEAGRARPRREGKR
ncbi:MAG: HEAT repeat domain-containing protein [Deltaproteobacteria bacterium]|nr:HEAT repeat domain-containing protein [Deltaproteobacteria bacterium]